MLTAEDRDWDPSADAAATGTWFSTGDASTAGAGFSAGDASEPDITEAEAAAGGGVGLGFLVAARSGGAWPVVVCDGERETGDLKLKWEKGNC